MRSGHVDAVTRMAVSGWAADNEAPDFRLALRIEVDGKEVGRTSADRPRRDLAQLGRYGDGHHGFSFVFIEPLDAARDVTVCVRFEDGRPLPNGTRVVPAQGGASAALETPAPPPVTSVQSDADFAPVLVTAPGRSGTTYLMSCLAACPEIVVAELVPYEVRLLSYYAAAFNVLTAPADLEKSTHPDRLEGDGFHIGFNPFTATQYAQAFRARHTLRDFQEHFAPARMGAAMADTVREYYRRLAADQGKPARFFAEKNNNLHRPSRLFVRRVFGGVRELVIVRDPRDVLCSHMAYFASSQEKAFHQLTHSNRQLTALQAEAGPDICVIRYEDMIASDDATYARLSDFLGTPIRPVRDQAGSRMFAQHATSESPQASMGRWRIDLPADLRLLCRENWGSFLIHFGYALD